MITVLKPGLLTTVQDRGRPGYRAQGMPLAGAMDGDAFAAANLLAGNDPGAAALELTLLGGAFRFDVDAVVGLAGADLQAQLDGVAVPAWASLRVRAGSTLAFAGARTGVRAYLAVRGGIDVPLVLGSRSTYTRARVGGVEGRALIRGDVLRIGPAAPDRAAREVLPVRPELGGGPPPSIRAVSRLRGFAPTLDTNGAPPSLVPSYPREVRLRVILGPQDDRFTPDALDTLLGTPFTVTNRNDRMAYVLDGPRLRHTAAPDIVSDGTVPGSVQVPGSGLPIVFMADGSTVGGYAKIATVISADLPRLAQAKAGDTVRFEPCTQAEAVAALRERAAWLEAIRGWRDGIATTGGGQP